jgi:curved DNA-binding protein CbpA
MRQICYYRVLELEDSCTDIEIKKAYRRLALRYHPGIYK